MIATTLIEWFTKFPALFAIAGAILTAIGIGVGGLVAVLILRKYGPAATGAAKELIELQRAAGEIQEKTLLMQKDHYEKELSYIQEELAQWKARAAEYEKSLHDRRGDWNAEKLKLVAENEQLKSRPDVTTLEKLYNGMAGTMKEISDSVAGREGPIMEALTMILTQSKKQMRVMGLLLREHREKKKLAAGPAKA